MFQIHDIRESRAYQETFAEGFEIGFKEGIEIGIKESMEVDIPMGFKKGAAIVRLAARQKSIAEIAAILELDAELVRRVLAQVDRD